MICYEIFNSFLVNSKFSAIRTEAMVSLSLTKDSDSKKILGHLKIELKQSEL